MGKLNRDALPDPITYFDGEGLKLSGPGKWKTTRCEFHGGSDSMRVNVSSGGWVCMSCGNKGGDVLAYHMARHGMEFIDAAKGLGAWIDDGEPLLPQRPTPLSARSAIQALAFEASLAAIAAGNLAKGVTLTNVDRVRLACAANRISRIAEDFR